MIPNSIVQTSVYKPYTNYTNHMQDKCKIYRHFVDDEILEFMQQNPIDECPNAIQTFNGLQCPQHKADYFRYYFLYIYGGFFIDSDALLEVPIETILSNEDVFDKTFFVVKSVYHRIGSFNGFMGCIPKHPILLSCLHYIQSNVNDLTQNYFGVCNHMWNCCDAYENKDTIFFTQELLCEQTKSVAFTIGTKGEKWLSHHFSHKENVYGNTKCRHEKKRIGISMFLGNNANGIFNSGVQQNALFFAELLVEMDYDVYIVCDNIQCENFNIVEYNANFKFITDVDVYSIRFDILFVFGYDFLNEHTVEIIKTNGTKIINYKCGYEVCIDGEAFCFKSERQIIHKNIYDEIWCIPQVYEMNHHYWEILYNCPVNSVPFVWSPVFVDKEGLLYEPNDETKNRISIFEPNISILKNALCPLLICEDSYKNGAKIEHVFVTNILDIKRDKNLNLDALNHFAENLLLHKDGKIHIEDRFHVISMMKHSAQVVVSNTLMNLNQMNYLYFDLAYMGYPILHNGSMCKDVGYYYECNNLKTAGQSLCKILIEHDNTYVEYRERNRLILERYMPKNKLLQHEYKCIINNILS